MPCKNPASAALSCSPVDSRHHDLVFSGQTPPNSVGGEEVSASGSDGSAGAVLSLLRANRVLAPWCVLLSRCNED